MDRLVSAGLKWWKVVVILFGLGMAWAIFEARLSAHFADSSEIVGISRESCYAMHKHANLNPSGCYDATHRGRKW